MESLQLVQENLKKKYKLVYYMSEKQVNRKIQ